MKNTTPGKENFRRVFCRGDGPRLLARTYKIIKLCTCSASGGHECRKELIILVGSGLCDV